MTCADTGMGPGFGRCTFTPASRGNDQRDKQRENNMTGRTTGTAALAQDGVEGLQAQLVDLAHVHPGLAGGAPARHRAAEDLHGGSAR